MFGGTPSNLAISCMSRPKVEVLAGINLPMLVKLAKVREERPLPAPVEASEELPQDPEAAAGGSYPVGAATLADQRAP